MIDAPGPWGTGSFVLTEGYSSINTRIGVMRPAPFACTWLIDTIDRTDTVVLEANRNHWNQARIPRLERVVFRNDLTPTEALERCMTTEGEVDIVTEVSPADAARVKASEHARLEVCDANRVLMGIFNRLSPDGLLGDRRVREALNLAVDRERVIREGLAGYANPLPALTPSWCAGYPPGQEPRPHDPARARQLLEDAGWPAGRPLRIAGPAPFEGIARMMAADIATSLGIATEVQVIPDADWFAALRILVEKKLAPTWDVLVFGWFDLSSEAPPAAVHREFFGGDGAFRVGPEDPKFNDLYTAMARELDGARLVSIAEQIDQYAYDEALGLFLCAPQVLYAVNKNVSFLAYKTAFELAETEVSEQHWSRRDGGGGGTPRPLGKPSPAVCATGSTGFYGKCC